MLQLNGVTLQTGGFRLDEITMSIPSGAYGLLMGATGSGKTSLLEAVCGLRPIVAGRILVDDRDITSLPVADRCLGYVPQDCAVFQTMTVRENLAFPMIIRSCGIDQRRARVHQLAEHLGISHLLDRKAIGLSGGESQRIALGRALACDPQVLLLDEPLSALDESTHAGMLEVLKRTQAETGVTLLHVTHSRVEASRLADVVFEITEGRVAKRDLLSLQVAAGKLL